MAVMILEAVSGRARSFRPVSATLAMSHFPSVRTRLKRSVPQWSTLPSMRNSKGAQTTARSLSMRMRGSWMRSTLWVAPGRATRSAKASRVIWTGLPSRMRTMVPAGEEREFEGGGIAVGHGVEHGLDGGEDGLFFRGCGLG